MKITLEINGTKIPATVDDKEIQKLTRPPTGYDADRNTWSECGKIAENVWAYKSCQAYSDQSVARSNARADKLMMDLRKFAAENGGVVAPFADSGFYLYWNYRAGRVEFRSDSLVVAGAVRFVDAKVATEAIKKFKDELEWYFRNYKPMPDGWYD